MQQQHRSEIEVSLNDSAVQGAIRRMTDGFKKLGDAGKRAIEASTPSQRTMQNIATGAIDAYERTASARRVAGIGLAYGARATIFSAKLAGRASLETARFGYNRAVDATQFGINSGANVANTLATGDTAGALRASGAIGAGAMNMMGLGKLAGALPFVGNIAGALVQRRMGRIGQVAGLERLQTELMLGGLRPADGFGGLRERFASYGLSGSEGLGLMRALQRGIGQESTIFSPKMSEQVASVLAESQLGGIDTNTIAQFVRGGAMGGGARGTTEQALIRALQVINTAKDIGMTGGGATRLLSAIASNTQRIASEGLQIDEKRFSEFVFGVSESARKRGLKQVEGIGALGTVQRFRGGVGGISGGFRSQFGGLARGALIASASRGARSPLDVINRLEDFQEDPELALRALRSQGMRGDMLRIALGGLGLSQDQVTALLGTRGGRKRRKLSDASFGRDAETIETGMAFSRLMQTQQESLISQVAKDADSAKLILELNTTMERFALSLTESNGLLMTTIRDDLKPAIDSLIEAFKDPSEYIKKILAL